jgi:hypothetical protein
MLVEGRRTYPADRLNVGGTMFLKLWNRLLARLRHRDLESEIDAELAFHLDMQTQANIARGMAPDQARREARIALGGVDQAREAVRDSRWTWLDSTWQDVRSATPCYGANRRRRRSASCFWRLRSAQRRSSSASRTAFSSGLCPGQIPTDLCA